MSTPAGIGIVTDDGKVKAIRCNYDGYVEDGTGEMLARFYKTKEDVESLLKHGEISTLSSSISLTVFYHRDMGEDLEPPTEFGSEEDYFSNGISRLLVDYLYLFKEGEWVYRECDDSAWQPLSEMQDKKETDRRVNILKNMDTVMRCVNDEENGVFETWLALGVPDGASKEDLEEIAEDKESYNDCVHVFAELISDLLVNGDWNKDGYSLELYNTREN